MDTMLNNDFYADPTVFDHWQNRAAVWVCSRLGRLCPYGWFAGFALAAGAVALVGAGAFAHLLYHAPGSENALAWNSVLAQGVTAMIALVASVSLFDQAIKAWPLGELPRILTGIARARRLECRDAVSSVDIRRPVAAPVEQVDREAVQAFFAEVRAAGVNVTIARALFRAGVRSASQLIAVPDAELLKISGVGPATLSRLRLHFATC
jgi:hypothetical protein